ncbi:hypothetical protein [Kitasatospora sp. NPDC004289]
MTIQQPTSTSSSRGLWVLVAVLVALLVAVVAGILTVVDGGSLVRAFLYGGAAFGGTLTLSLLVLAALRVL